MRRITTLAVAGLLALAACGDDGGPSREEFAREAEKICADVEKATQRMGEPKSVAEIGQFASDIEAQVKRAVERLDQLEVPEGEDGDKAQAFVDQLKQDSTRINAALGDLRRAAQAKDSKAIVEAAERIEGIDTERSDKLARDIGANGCAD